MKRAPVWCTLVLALAAPGVTADTGYHTDYDYSGQGDDWYGHALPDPRRDFPPAHPVDTASDGDDFRIGFEILVAGHGFGPPLERTTDSRSKYIFRFGSRLVDPGECYVDAHCADGLFCNGDERCLSGFTCGSGSVPDCSDSDACTSDWCNTGSDACAHDPLADPGEVPGLLLGKPGPEATVANLQWSGLPAADTYNLYRGALNDLADLECFMAGVVGVSIDDDGAVGATGLIEYLVTAVGCGGESTLGDNSGGEERVAGDVCP